MKPKSWPRIGKPAGESRYGFSEDDDLIESAIDELLEAANSKDHKRLVEALTALINCVINREESHAPTDESA